MLPVHQLPAKAMAPSLAPSCVGPTESSTGASNLACRPVAAQKQQRRCDRHRRRTSRRSVLTPSASYSSNGFGAVGAPHSPSKNPP